MSKFFTKPSHWILSLLVIAALAVLITLGNWQMRRLAWKETLIATVTERVGADPQPVPDPQSWPDVSRDSHVYQPVTINGCYDFTKEVHVWFAIKDPQGGDYAGPGYMLLTALTTADGWYVLVNRGFVPEQMKEHAARKDIDIACPSIQTGLMRFDEPKSWLSPEPDLAKNVWIIRNVADMTAYLKLDPQKTAPYWIDLTKGQGVNGLPQGGETRIAFTNNHLQYAFTWYGLAAVLVLVALAGLIGILRKRHIEGQPQQKPQEKSQKKSQEKQ